MCAQGAVATRRGSSADAPSSTETTARCRTHLGSQKRTTEPRERISTKVSAESDLCVPCRLPPSAQFPRGLQRPLLVLSSSQTVVHELSQAFSCQQLAFRQEFVSELLHFSVLSSQLGTLPFEDFSILLEEIACGSFSGLIVIPPVSIWSRARNSGVRGPPPLRSRQSPMGIQGHCHPKLLEQVRGNITEALELCVMALDVWCKSVPSRPFFFVAPEDRGGQQQHGPASIWQLAEKSRSFNVLVK